MAGEDPVHVERIKQRRCAMCRAHGPVEAHHSTASQPGMAKRSHDHEAIPLCAACHRDFHGASARFRWMGKEGRRDWQRTMVALYRPPPCSECGGESFLGAESLRIRCSGCLGSGRQLQTKALK